MAFPIRVGRFEPPIWRDERTQVALGAATNETAAFNTAAYVALGYRRDALDPVDVTMIVAPTASASAAVNARTRPTRTSWRMAIPRSGFRMARLLGPCQLNQRLTSFVVPTRRCRPGRCRDHSTSQMAPAAVAEDRIVDLVVGDRFSLQVRFAIDNDHKAGLAAGPLWADLRHRVLDQRFSMDYFPDWSQSETAWLRRHNFSLNKRLVFKLSPSPGNDFLEGALTKAGLLSAKR